MRPNTPSINFHLIIRYPVCPYSGTINIRVPVRCHVLDLEGNDITAAQLAVDGQIELPGSATEWYRSRLSQPLNLEPGNFLVVFRSDKSLDQEDAMSKILL